MPSPSVNTAAKKIAAAFDDEAGLAFKAAFQATGCMDLYAGRVSQYLDVMRSELLHRQRTIERLQKLIGDAHKILHGEEP